MKLSARAHDLGVKGLPEVVTRAKALGLDGVQLVAYKVLPEVAQASGAMTAEKAAEIGSAFREAGLNIPLIGAYFNPAHPDAATAQKGEEIFADYLRAARLIGAEYVGSETGAVIDNRKQPFYPENRSDEALTKVVGSFTRLCDIAAEANASVAIEGAFWHTCYDVKRLAQARERIGRDNLKIIFDLYNYMDASNIESRYEVLEEGLETFGTDIIAFHLKDCRLKDGRLEQIPVGRLNSDGETEGLFDYGRILAAIRRVNPEAELVLEGTVGADIEPAIQFIRSYGL